LSTTGKENDLLQLKLSVIDLKVCWIN